MLVTLTFPTQVPRMTVDTDPKHMLQVTSPVRQYNDQVERDFALHADVLALGIVNDRGVLNRETLAHYDPVACAISTLRQSPARSATSLATASGSCPDWMPRSRAAAASVIAGNPYIPPAPMSWWA